MGRWEPPSTHTHKPPPPPPPPPVVCKRAASTAVQNVFPRPQLCWVVTLRSTATTERRKKGRRRDCFAEITVFWPAIFVGSCTIWEEVDAFLAVQNLTCDHWLFKRLINFNRMLRFVDVFEAYSGIFFKELTCLVWFDLRPELGTERKACFCFSMEWEQNLNWDWGVLTMTVSVQLLNHSVGLFLVVWGDNAVHGVCFESIDCLFGFTIMCMCQPADF